MELYMQKLVENGPLIWPTIEENRVTTTKKYAELSATEKIQADCDMKATNIILQGLPADIYSLVNLHRVAKDLWERGRQNSYTAGTSGIRANTSGPGGNYSGQQRVVKCFNCQGEGHMARHCTKTKRKRDATWFRDKVLLVKAQGNAYHADDLDAYDSDYDEISTAKAVLIANLSSYGSDVLFKVPHSDNTHNDILNQSVQEMWYSEQTHLVNFPENEITSDSNIIPYS
ncbi:integrase, catalytic region, zinc finger, CCHC-type containing protein [Tanacetum coccineum]